MKILSSFSFVEHSILSFFRTFFLIITQNWLHVHFSLRVDFGGYRGGVYLKFKLVTFVIRVKYQVSFPGLNWRRRIEIR